MTAKRKIKLRNGGYFAIHSWLARHYDKADRCEGKNCRGNSTNYHWAKLPDKEYAHDRDNFIRLCVSCHRLLDFTEEIRQKMSEAHRGQKPNNVRSVMQTGIDGAVIKIYNDIDQAAKECGILRTAIMNALAGRSKTSGGFKWNYQT